MAKVADMLAEITWLMLQYYLTCLGMVFSWAESKDFASVGHIIQNNYIGI
jgi:hypothetical protein